MKMIVHPSYALNGSLVMPGDKSLSHRAVLLAAIAKGHSRITNIQVSGVTMKMLEAVCQLGVDCELEGHALNMDSPGIQGWREPNEVINCGSSATTLRLLAGALAASGLPAILDGSAGLRVRPMDRILEPLQTMGVPVDGFQGKYAPVRLNARPSHSKLQAIHHVLPVSSAQVKSCLLLAGLDANGLVVVHEPDPSRDHTERMLQHMGVKLETSNDHSGHEVVIYPPVEALTPLHVHLPGDLSSAAFLIVAALILPGSRVTIQNVGLNPGRTGLLDTLFEMGADLQVTIKGEQAGEPFGDITVRYSHLHSAQVSGERVVRMIDEFPAFAVAAAFAHGRSIIKDAQELRYKESDRISCLCQELGILGIDIQETADGFIVNGPTSIRAAVVHPHGDHRLAMALTIAGLAGTEQMTVEDAQIIHESYPEFVDHLARLGAKLDYQTES